MRYLTLTYWLSTILVLILNVSPQKLFSQEGTFNSGTISDTQLVEFWNKAKQTGYSLETLPSVFQSRGLEKFEIQNLMKRIRAIDVSDPKDLEEEYTGGNSYANEQEFAPIRVLSEYERKIFGYRVFRNKKIELSASTNAAPSDSYIIGPSDQIEVVIYGNQQDNFEVEIKPNGSIIVPQFGPISVGGLTVLSAKSLITSKLSNIYKGLGQKDSGVFVDISFQSVRNVRVNILGEVENPGSFDLPPNSTVFSSLYAAGGPTVNASLRKVKLFRGGRLVEVIDVYDYLLSGIIGQKQALQDEDVIMLDVFEKRVELKGAVRNPGFYEPNEDENIQELVRYAGGFNSNANKENFTLERLKSENNLLTEINLKTSSDDLLNGDRILIREYFDSYIEKVQIEGAVVLPGVYNRTEGMTIFDLLDRAEGLQPDAILERITVYKLGQDLIPTISTISVDDVIDLNNYLVEVGDIVKIPGRIGSGDINRINVSGDVVSPGTYPFYKGMKLFDALSLSKGITDKALGGVIEVVRRPSDNYEELVIDKYTLSEGMETVPDVVLLPYDHVFVRSHIKNRSERIVKVEGEVIYPGEYSLPVSGMKISDLLKRVGGFTTSAYLEGVTVIRKPQELGDNYEKEREKQLTSLLAFLKESDLTYSISATEYKRLEEIQQEAARGILWDNYIQDDNLKEDSVAYNYVKFSEDSEVKKRKYFQIGISVSELMEDSSSSSNLTLLDGDIIIVPTKSNTVEIAGEVFYPTTVRYSKQKKYKDYVTQAGGFRLNAKVNRSYIIYQNGEVARVRRYVFFRKWPKVTPGAQIVIPDGRVRGAFSPERLLAITSSLISTYLTIELLRSTSTGG